LGGTTGLIISASSIASSQPPAERVYRAFIDPAALSKWLAASGFPDQFITWMRKSGSDSMCMSSGNFPGPPFEIGNAPEVRWNSRDHQRNRSSDSTPPRDGFANGIP